MTLYDLTKKYAEGKGEGMMWKTVQIISDAVESGMDESAKRSLMRRMTGAMNGNHYNEETARDEMASMCYTDAAGEKHHAPFWPASAVRSFYEQYKGEIPDYNEWDYAVTMNMLASDNWHMLKRWFPNYSEADFNKRLADMAATWLADEDWPTRTKIWDYLSMR